VSNCGTRPKARSKSYENLFSYYDLTRILIDYFYWLIDWWLMIDWLFRNHTPARHPSVLNVTRTRAHCANIRRRMAAAFSISRKRSVRWTVVIDHTIDLSVSSRVSRSSIMALASAALPALSPVSVQTQSIALASSQSWLPLLRPSIPIGIALAFVAW